jgi:hypothetical protein
MDRPDRTSLSLQDLRRIIITASAFGVTCPWESGLCPLPFTVSPSTFGQGWWLDRLPEWGTSRVWPLEMARFTFQSHNALFIVGLVVLPFSGIIRLMPSRCLTCFVLVSLSLSSLEGHGRCKVWSPYPLLAFSTSQITSTGNLFDPLLGDCDFNHSASSTPARWKPPSFWLLPTRAIFTTSA